MHKSKFAVGKPRKPPSGWDYYPNLRRRPYSPNKGRGRLQRAAKRALIAHGGEATSSEIYAWSDTWPDARRHYRSVWRVLIQIADPVRRVPPYGAWLWRLKDEGPSSSEP